MNVFFVGSPLEYLNALEARAHYGISASDAVLLILQTYEPHLGGRDLQLPPLVDDGDWQRVDWFTRRKHGYLAMLRIARQVERQARELGDVERLFLGGYLSTVRRHFANRCVHRELVLLDEGVSTLHVHALRRSARGARFEADAERMLLSRARQRWARGGPLRSALMRMLGIRDAHPPALTYFTMYDIEPDAHDRVVRNTYGRLRSQVRRGATLDEVLFLGEPLNEAGIIADEATYLKLVRNARDAFPNRAFRYKPHRHEEPDKLERLQRALAIEIQPSSLPVEALLVSSDARPAVLAGSYSSALGTCARIFGDSLPVHAFVLPHDQIAADFQQHIANIVRHYERPSSGIHVARVQL